MKLEYRKLSLAEIEPMLAMSQGWSVNDGILNKTFTFNDYMDGVQFALRVGKIADELNHHPDILITWRKVTVSVHTHDVDGLSPYDFELARLIEVVK